MIAVLGLGEMGLVHARNLARSRAIRLALASTREAVAARAAASLHADASYTSYEDALADPDVSGVVIATAPGTHPALMEAAAHAGKHIFCEKPLGFSVEDVLAASRAVEHSGVRFMTGFMRRWDRGYVRAKQLVDSGDIGLPVVLKCTSGDPEYPEKYQREAAPNSMLKDLAVHDIDLARWLLKSEVKRVYVIGDALSYPILKEMGDSDVTVGVLEMHSGAKVIFHFSRALDYGYNVTSELVAQKGTVQIGELKMTSAVTLQGQKSCTDVAWHFSERFEDAFARQMDAFAALTAASEVEATALLSNNPSYAGVEDGLVATVVSEALVESANTGLPVDVAPLSQVIKSAVQV